MKIGIDFGTTYTKIAYLDERGNLELFRYPGPTGRNYIPTAVAYRWEGNQEIISIGEAARSDALNYEGVLYAENFKMLLPIRDESGWRQHGWNLDRNPDEVTRDYFDQLLRAAEHSLKHFLGSEPESIVVSVPELWQRTANNPGAEALRRILINDLRLPVDHLRSEPICAAAYFVHEYQRVERRFDRQFNLLVCDMGGGTFDVALCRVIGQKIEVLDFDGSGQQGLGSAGALFDHNAVKAALSEHGEKLSEPEFTDLLRAFEDCKIQKHGEVSAILELDDPRLADTVIYQFRRKYRLTFAQVQECFKPIAQGISEVLKRIQNRAENKGLSIDRVVIVGGFGQFPLVQRAILQSLGIQDPNDVRFDTTLHREHRQFFAIAYGAALIANGLIEPVEYYPHTIEILVALRTPDGSYKETFLPILEAGKVPAGQERPHWAHRGEERIVVSVISKRVQPLPVYIRLHGSGDRLRLNLPSEEYPDPGEYHVGITIDRSNMGVLIFQSKDGTKRREYRLGNVNPTLIVEER